MTATSSVASSRPMFNPFNQQPAQNSAPVLNPFANNTPSQGSLFGHNNAGASSASQETARKSPFGAASDNAGAPVNPFLAAIGNQSGNAKQKPTNSFGTNDGHTSDGGKAKRKPGPASSLNLASTAKKLPNGRLESLKPLPEDSRPGTRGQRKPRSRQTSPSSPSSDHSDDSDTPTTSRSNDPHAKRVYEQLRKDGISPPQWPSKPGEPRNKAAMAKFRDSYEAYRSKVRASLTKAGLIDDPDKRKTLKDAIAFKGICEDMCPEFEKITRITEFDINYPEKNPKTSVPNTRRMVKKLARSAAGQEAPLPMDVRSIPALKRSLDYLIDVLLKRDGNLPVVHGFLWDRTRAIRRDFTFFSSLTAEEMKTQVYVLENIARFHVTALHLLSQDGKSPEDFVEQQELEQLGKALLSLRDVYDDCSAQGILCENEAEFRAYYLVFHAHDPNIMEILQRQWSPTLWRDSDEIRTAVSLVEAMQNTQDFHGPLKDAPSMAASSAYHSYFRIVEDATVSYTMACFAECHFPRIRRSILAAVKKGLARPKESTKDVTAAVLNKFLRFDTTQEAISFAQLHDLEFAPDPEAPSDPSRQYLVLNNRAAMSHPRLQHQFSRDLVEKKRGSLPLPDLIHRTVFENSSPGEDNGSTPGEESLFVPQQETSGGSNGFSGGFSQGPLSQASWGKPNEAKSPFTSEIKPPASVPAISPFAQPKPVTETPASQPKPAESAPTFTNPFGSTQGGSFQPKTSFATTGPTEKTSGSQPNVAQLGAAQSQTAFAQKPNPAIDSSPKPNPFGTASPFTNAPSKPLASGTGDETQAAKPSAFFAAPGITASPGTTLTPSTQSPTITSGATHKSMFPPPQPTPSPSKASTTFPPTKPEATTRSAAQAPGSLSHPLDHTPTEIPKPPLGTANPGLMPPPPIPRPRQPSPPRDVFGDFTKWFVQGDSGLLEEFQVFMVETMLQPVFETFKKKEEERIRKEEEKRDNAKADRFRAYNLSLKMFYRWRDNAREKRLKELRRTGREQARAFYEAQRAAESKARKDAARKAQKEKAQRVPSDRPQELMSLLKNKKASKKEAEEALLASGVLSGVVNEREAVAKIVRREYDLPAGMASGRSTRSPSVSSTRGGGSKTRALRESLLGDYSGFRRSLPSMSSRDASPETTNRTIKVSERWRLKAMGIVQMPDGTAVPESLADEMAYSGKKYPGLRTLPHESSSRRASITEPMRPASRHALLQSQGSASMELPNEPGSPNKRKRSSDDDGAALKQGEGEANAHKRVMSDAETLIAELRTMREEMEEGATWFKSQNSRLQSEIASRASTPWEGSI